MGELFLQIRRFGAQRDEPLLGRKILRARLQSTRRNDIGERPCDFDPLGASALMFFLSRAIAHEAREQDEETSSEARTSVRRASRQGFGKYMMASLTGGRSAPHRIIVLTESMPLGNSYRFLKKMG